MLDPFSTEELEFIEAIEAFKAEHNRAFLSWTEVLAVLRGLGYRKTQRTEREVETPPLDPGATA